MSKEQQQEIDLDELVSDINDFADQAETYYTEDDGNGNCYIESLQYGEYEINSDWNDDLPEYIQEDLDSLNLSKDELKFLLIEASEPVFIGEYHSWLREIASVGLGEIEVQLSDELTDRIDALDPAQVEYVEFEVQNYMSDNYVYLGMNHCRWALRYNEDILEELIVQMKREISPEESEIRRIKEHFKNKGLVLVG